MRQAHVSGRDRKWLFLSGVDISRDSKSLGTHDPFPDYLVLRNAFAPDILDMQTINGVANPLVRLALRLVGPYWAIAIAALLSAKHYDAVFATGEDVGLRVALLAKLLHRRVPLVMTCHNIASRGRVFLLAKLKVGSAVAKFLCLSQAQARILTERYDIEAGRLCVMGWFVDHEYFSPFHDIALPNQICSAGMASRDYATLVEATRDLPVEVKIAADSPWFRQGLNVAQDDLPPRLEVRSYGTYQALRRLYGESLFVVVPLLDVEFSAGYSVILEAMAMGKCVVVSKIKQQDDFVIDGWNGFYVTPGNAEELRNRIDYLIHNRDEAQRLGANARHIVEQEYTFAQLIRHVKLALEDVAAA